MIERTETAGIDFVHENGGRGDFYYVEIIGSGGALLDFDGDGDLDLYAVQGAVLGTHDAGARGNMPRDRFFRNESSRTESSSTERQRNATSSLRFVDATDAIGLDQRGYGMGVATGDFNNDGWVDLYLTQLGANILLRNVQGKHFEDVTAQAGDGALAGRGMSTSAAFVDLDGDGWLDLYVVDYLRYDLASDKACFDMVGLREYCGPQSYAPARDSLFRNRGDGTFETITTSAGIDRDGAGLGVVTGDFDGDGRIDIYVANDQAPNHLWMNAGDFTFVEEAMIRGSAVDGQGRAEASMGVDAVDLDHDGDLDLHMTHLISETNTLYRNDGDGYFEDVSLQTLLGTQSLRWTGFGCAFFDLDRNGWLDLVVANGAVRADPTLRSDGDPFPYREPNLLFLNDGGQGWTEVGHTMPAFGPLHVSRGVTPGDLDNDGDLDLLVFNNRGRLQVFENPLRTANPWIGLSLIDRHGRDALGAKVTLRGSTGKLTRWLRTTSGFLAARDPRLLIGLEPVGLTPSVEVVWPTGEVETWSALMSDRYHRLVEGTGDPGAQEGRP